MSLTNDNAVGDEKEVRCFQCDVFRANWKPGDDPLIDHDSFDTECPYRKTEQKKVTTEKVATLPSTTIKRRMGIGPSQDAHEKHAQNPQRTSQSDKNTDPLYPISTRTQTKHELSQSTSVANQDDRFASDPKKGKYTKEGIDYENEGIVNGSSVNTTGENVCSNISDGAEHTNDSDMKSGKMCDIGTIIAQDNMQQNGDAINKPYLTVTNGSMTTNDKVGNITTLPLQQSDVADSKDTCAIVALALPNNNKAGGNEGVTRKYISDAEVSDVLNPERNPSYSDENARRETYRKWPSAANHKIESLVDAGFFYTGKEDIVRCFFCDIGLAEWSNDDDPWEEHARHSPDCPHLKDRKSDEFSSAIQAKWLKVCSPRHQQYTDMMTLESSWPGDVVLQLPKDLAAACFFYTDMLDTIDDTEKAVLIYTRDDGNKDVINDMIILCLYLSYGVGSQLGPSGGFQR
ncbi:uncharacterized protein LOC110443946 [Mizuhopecten yessoensis]|uniref:Baculoviral IAP repeat-containing protein 7 n=1 Tax=Mizuhopecten yessoensis TaxID=6573 RepID=A0A210PDW4_MIZYE|nr:uncharacterized protein LOC110443946 [Mizuhopecten yessoensis]OWF34641.1 Baculoviral IAP repeat-containing protein 7 [Mizuhopecten yessoensis]